METVDQIKLHIHLEVWRNELVSFGFAAGHKTVEVSNLLLEYNTQLNIINESFSENENEPNIQSITKPRDIKNKTSSSLKYLRTADNIFRFAKGPHMISYACCNHFIEFELTFLLTSIGV
jgi:hypothetical protein